MTQANKWLRTAEAAKVLNVTQNTISNFIKNGKIVAKKVRDKSRHGFHYEISSALLAQHTPKKSPTRRELKNDERRIIGVVLDKSSSLSDALDIASVIPDPKNERQVFDVASDLRVKPSRVSSHFAFAYGHCVIWLELYARSAELNPDELIKTVGELMISAMEL